MPIIKLLPVAFVFLSGLLYLQTAIADTTSPLPDFGVIWNDDGDWSITSSDPKEAARGVEFVIDLLAGTPVKTLAYSVAAGSEIMLYPSKVADTWGWRKTGYDEKKGWKDRIEKGRTLAGKNFDAVRVAANRAKELGLYFFPSYRMNDDHFIWDPLEYPLTGRFWMKHQQFAIKNAGESPIETYDEYANMLDFSHAEVRKFRMDIMLEVLDRYQDVMDGFEMDFSRYWIFFPRGQGQKKGHLITDMVQGIRHHLNQLERKNNRNYYLMVRVPTCLKSCHWAGLEIEHWLEKKLVDVLVPTQIMVPVFELPLDEFVPLARRANCKVYGGLYSRVGWEWPFVENPTADTYAADATRSISTPMMRALASNYWHLGADGMYLFNMRYEKGGDGPFTDAYFRLIRDVAHPACLNGESKVYCVTKAYWLDHEDNYTFKKQLPQTLIDKQKHTFRLVVGENFTPKSSRAGLRYCGLRLGFRDIQPQDEITVTVNGHTLYTGPMIEHLIKLSGKAPFQSQGMAPEAREFWQYHVSDTDMLKRGYNEIYLQVNMNKKDRSVVVTDINLGVFYNNNLNEMLFN